ncbi:MAG: DUF1127 domain-containing protein [Acetobacteraceae bacterium]
MTVLRWTITPSGPTRSGGFVPDVSVARRDRPRRGRHALVSMLRACWRRHRSRVALTGLNAHMLKDIGLTAAEAEFEANKPFWRV